MAAALLALLERSALWCLVLSSCILLKFCDDVAFVLHRNSFVVN